MNPFLFQVFALILLTGLLAGTIAGAVRGSITRREELLWGLIWLSAGVAIAWPEVTVKVARTLGIGRGADLVLYCAVVMMPVGFLMVYGRLRRLRRELTLLVRQLAIRDAVSIPPAEARQAPETPKDDPGN